jgi:hypothetical protein
MTIIATGAALPPPEPKVSAHRPDAAATGFMMPAMAAQEASGRARNASPIIDTRTMLALQEQVGREADRPAETADREARRHGQDILEALAALQKDLLRDGVPTDGLSRLTALTTMIPAAHDPALARILAAIRLRARLEIVRMTPRPPSAPASVEPAEAPASMTEP